MPEITTLKQDLEEILGPDKVFTTPEDLFAYSGDSISSLVRNAPDAVVLPKTTEEVSLVAKYAWQRGIPITPRGAGSGLSGGCTPLCGGIAVDMKRMNRIIEINRGNMTATVESGVVLSSFHRAVEKKKMFYPPDPQSMSVCTIGGNVATRAGGPRCLKYGTTGHYVLGLTVVLPDGRIMETGGTCVKQSVGYDLTRLFTGSEGTLGIITQIHLRLLPLPENEKTIIVTCESVDNAAKTVSEIVASGAVPSMLEFVSQGAAGLMNGFLNPPLSMEAGAYLFIKVDGSHAQTREEAEKIKLVCEKMNAAEIRVVEDLDEAASYWTARTKLYPLLISFLKKVITEDVTVPRDKVPEFVRKVEEISQQTGVLMGIAGHAGDGNMHPAIMMTEITEEAESKAQDAIGKLVRAGLALGGSVSGEHGIGIHKAEFMPLELGGVQMDIIGKIKKAIDPKGIMNPGKFI